jgi:hypothetical protein
MQVCLRAGGAFPRPPGVEYESTRYKNIAKAIGDRPSKSLTV